MAQLTLASLRAAFAFASSSMSSGFSSSAGSAGSSLTALLSFDGRERLAAGVADEAGAERFDDEAAGDVAAVDILSLFV